MSFPILVLINALALLPVIYLLRKLEIYMAKKRLEKRDLISKAHLKK